MFTKTKPLTYYVTNLTMQLLSISLHPPVNKSVVEGNFGQNKKRSASYKSPIHE